MCRPYDAAARAAPRARRQSTPTHPIILDSADVMPRPVDGIERLEQSIQYPDFERRAGIEGAVVVQCVVGETGTASNVEVTGSVTPGLDRAAVQAVPLRCGPR